MGYTQPITRAEVRQMQTLRSDGLNSIEIAEEIGRSVQTVDKYLCESREWARGYVTVVEDANDIYTPGAQFGKHDLAAGMRLQTWPAGVRFHVNGRGEDYTAVTKVILVRDDGLVLQVDRGGHYRWVIPVRF